MGMVVQSGIGTYNIPQIAKPMMAKLKKTVDSMLGVHLDAHVMSGYEFLMQNCELSRPHLFIVVTSHVCR